MKPEFLAINPQHCVPTMVDGDLALWESRPICTYLASQYGKDDSLYPKDPKTRAKALGWLNDWLAGHDWAVGNNLTVADHSLVATVSTMEATGIDLAKHTNISSWLGRCKTKM
ncbi:Glutathione S-transferase 1-like 6, partial [Homarus americanus]